MRDEKHLAWVRTLPCCVCTRSTAGEAHHDTQGRGMGQKADDTRTIPLCRMHHDGAQHYRGPFKGWDKHQMREWFEEKLIAVMAQKEEHMRLHELPMEDDELILAALMAHSVGLRKSMDCDPGLALTNKHRAIVAGRCDELAERIRGAT